MTVFPVDKNLGAATKKKKKRTKTTCMIQINCLVKRQIAFKADKCKLASVRKNNPTFTYAVTVSELSL